MISFSGGVADCIGKEHPSLAFGDMGPVLGRCIRQSRLCAGEYRLGTETIRATVIGAGCHSVQLSGSTVFYQNIRFPLKNIPTAVVRDPKSPEDIRQALQAVEADRAFLVIPGQETPDYQRVKKLAEQIAAAFGDSPVLVCLEADYVKALGHALRLQLEENHPCLCMDGIRLETGTYLDVGEPVGPALPAVIKTLVLSGGKP